MRFCSIPWFGPFMRPPLSLFLPFYCIPRLSLYSYIPCHYIPCSIPCYCIHCNVGSVVASLLPDTFCCSTKCLGKESTPWTPTGYRVGTKERRHAAKDQLVELRRNSSPAKPVPLLCLQHHLKEVAFDSSGTVEPRGPCPSCCTSD